MFSDEDVQSTGVQQAGLWYQAGAGRLGGSFIEIMAGAGKLDFLAYDFP